MSTVAEMSAQLAELNKKADATADLLRTGMARRHTGAQWVNPGGAPTARRGEDIMGSRGFSFAKMICGLRSKILPDQWKIEREFGERLMEKMLAQHFQPEHSSSFLAPIWPDGFNETVLDNGMYHEMKGLLAAGMDGYDPDEATWLAQKHFPTKAAVSPAMSWVDQTTGGSFVPPASFGSPIELLRPKEVMMQAGATVVPLGPSGKITFPRLAAAIQGGVSAENVQQTPTTPKTGNLTLSAKKVISVVVLPGELLRFGGPAVESLVRNDIFKTVALIADYYYLHGAGSDTQTLGLATMGAAAGNPYGVGIVTPNASNQMAGQDVYSFPSAVEAASGEMTAYLMRPEMKWALRKARFTPYSGGTNQGGFLFEFTRSLEDGGNIDRIEGMKLVTSTNISKTRGNGSQTWVGGINGPDYYLGLFGAIEFTQTDAGWTLLSSDQVAVRALLHTDGGMRHPAQFAFLDAANMSVSG